MTVQQLIDLLKALPLDYEVYREGGEYKDDWRKVWKIDVDGQTSLRRSQGVYLS